MKCQRCGNGKITHRVMSDIIDWLVCTDCAHQADAKGLIVTSTGRKAARPSRRAANKVQAGHQSQDSQEAWPYDPASVSRAGG